MTDLSGQSVDRYHILGIIGQGGMATVYRARDTRLGNEVAVKVIRKEAFPAEVHDRILKRFEREARVLARMSHPNIVKVHAFGEYNGAPYLVMDLISEKTLKDISKPLHYRQAIQLLLPVAHALEHAHQKGILHRDVKPSNILIGAGGEPMLADFGIAKLLEEGEGHTLTGTGVGVGTPEYMAPEQGLGKEVDVRADIYALGIVLFELLTGQKPFTADTPMAVVIKQINDPLPRPRLINDEIPVALEEVLIKALAKQPEDRYSEMGALVAAFESVLRGNEVSRETVSGLFDQDRHRAGGDKKTPKIAAHFEAVTRDDYLPRDTSSSPLTTDNVQEEPRKKRLPYILSFVGLLCAVSVGIVLIIYGFSTINNSMTSQPEEPAAVSGAVITEPPELSPTILQSNASGSPAPASTAIVVLPSFAPDVIQLNNVFELREIHRWSDRYNYRSSVSWESDSQGFFLADIGYGYSRYDISTRSVQRFREDMRNIYMAALFPDGLYYATRDFNFNQINVWQHGTDALAYLIRGETGYFGSYPVFSPDGQLLAGVLDDAILFWDAKDGSTKAVLDQGLAYQPGSTPELISTFSNDSNYYAAGNAYSGKIKVWDVATNTLLSTIQWHEGLRTLGFSPDGTILVSGGLSYSNRDVLRFWDITTGNLIRKVTRSNENINSVAFSVDGKLVFSGSEAGVLRAWGVPSSDLITTVANTGGTVNLLSISPNGKYLVTAGEEVILFAIQTP